jgi:hypothetical protein
MIVRKYLAHKNPDGEYATDRGRRIMGLKFHIG